MADARGHGSRTLRVSNTEFLGPRVGPDSLFLGFGFPYEPLETKKGLPFIPGLLLGLVLTPSYAALSSAYKQP